MLLGVHCRPFCADPPDRQVRGGPGDLQVGPGGRQRLQQRAGRPAGGRQVR